MTWFTATSVSVANGATIVSVNTGDDIAIAQEAGGLIIGQNPPVEIKRTYLDGGGAKKIELRSAWPHSTQTTQPAVAFPTDGDLAAATAVLKGLIDGFTIASQVEAEAGTDNIKLMTPLRTKQSIRSDILQTTGTSTTKVMSQNSTTTSLSEKVSKSGGTMTGSLTISGANALRGSYGGGGIPSNFAAGDGALQANTTGDDNIASGLNSLASNTTGRSNTASGGYSLNFNTTGSGNTASGTQALYSNTTGLSNTASGYQSLYSNTIGGGNIGVGGRTSLGVLSPVFSTTTENDRIVMGSTAVTNAYVQVAWTVVSDRRDKTNIENLDLGLDFISKLKPVSYNFRISRDSDEVNGNKRYGFIAQDILEVEGDDNVIIDNEVEEKLKFNDQSLQAVMVKAIQDLHDIVKQQAIEIQQLKKGA